MPPTPLRIGQHVIRLRQIDSTSAEARRRIAGGSATDGLAIRADEQTAGHGRFGRSWRSAPGAGLLVSIVLADGRAPGGPRALTAAGALAALEACGDVAAWMESSGARRIEPVRPEIHWPNDVVLHGRKLAGVLIEQATGPGGAFWIAGIGINVKGRVAPLETAITLEEAFGGRAIGVDAVAERLYARLDAWLRCLATQGLPPLATAWRRRSGLMGRAVRLTLNGQARLGRVHDVSLEEGLVILTDTGTTFTAPPERTTGVEVVGG